MRSRVLDPCILIRVQSWEIPQAVPLQAERVLALSWPRTVGTVGSGAAQVICIGPTDWLVLAQGTEGAQLLAKLHEAFAGSVFRATDCSSAFTRIEIDGTHARVLLAKGCSFDLHRLVFPPGRCARTRLAGMPVVFRCTESSGFECIVSVSYRDYLLAWLADAAAEFLASGQPIPVI